MLLNAKGMPLLIFILGNLENRVEFLQSQDNNDGRKAGRAIQWLERAPHLSSLLSWFEGDHESEKLNRRAF